MLGGLFALDYAAYGLRRLDWTVRFWMSVWVEFASALPGVLLSGCSEFRFVSSCLRACVFLTLRSCVLRGVEGGARWSLGSCPV